MRVSGQEFSELPLSLPGPNTGILQNTALGQPAAEQRELSLGLIQWSGRNSLAQNPWWRRWDSGNPSPSTAKAQLPPFASALRQLQESFRYGGMNRGIEQTAS